jgi:putative ABC transport system permease protein
VNDLALWLADGADLPARCRRPCAAPREAGAPGADGLDTGLEFASAAQIRATSLRIFDRSFAVTYWLQAVAIAIGLFGVAASFSAQVLARRKEFGLLAHLGLTRARSWPWWPAKARPGRPSARWPGWLLGLAVSGGAGESGQPAELSLDHGPVLPPWARLLALCAAVVAGRHGDGLAVRRAAAGRDAVLAVKEDW